jgi:excisionase family DNA binding protein
MCSIRGCTGTASSFFITKFTEDHLDSNNQSVANGSSEKRTIKDPLLTLPEIADELRCSKAHVSHLINGKVSGVPTLPAIALGRRRLIRRSTFEQWKKLTEAAGQPVTLLPLNDAVSA